MERQSAKSPWGRVRSENAAHQDFKNKLLQFLRNGVAGQPAPHTGIIAFPCNDHLRLWHMPPWAAWVESERFRKTPEGVRYKPDIVLLDDRNRPLAILEVTASNLKNNCQRAADDLNIPWFRFWAPHHQRQLRRNSRLAYTTTTASVSRAARTAVVIPRMAGTTKQPAGSDTRPSTILRS